MKAKELLAAVGLIVMWAVMAWLLLVSMACVRVDYQAPDKSRLRVTTVGIDPTVKSLKYGTFEMADGGWSSDPGVRMMETLFEAGRQVGMRQAVTAPGE